MAANLELPSWRLHLMPRGPVSIFGMLHAPERPTNRLVIFVPGAIEGAILTGRQDFNPLAQALDNEGFALMLLQMSTAVRTTANAIFETCLGDISAGVELAQSLGYDEIVLIGLSLGGPRVMYYMYHEGHRQPAIKMIMLLASIESPYESSVNFGGEDGKAHYEASLERARAAIAAGQPNEVIVGRLNRNSLALTAKGYLSLLGNPKECDASTIKFAKCIKVPAVVVHGEGDEISSRSQADSMYSSLAGAPSRELILIPDCPHQTLTAGATAERTSAIISEVIARTLSNAP